MLFSLECFIRYPLYYAARETFLISADQGLHLKYYLGLRKVSAQNISYYCTTSSWRLKLRCIHENLISIKMCLLLRHMVLIKIDLQICRRLLALESLVYYSRISYF